MLAGIARTGSTLIVALYLLTFGCAMAQSPAVNPVDADYAAQQQQRQVQQPLNNQPVWSEARSGQPQFTSIPGRETNVLIQPRGQTWRAAALAADHGWADFCSHSRSAALPCST